MQLDDLGDRICILGPSNSGKSTLAEAIARKRGLVPFHLDQLFHLENTDWVPRPDADFLALHDEAIRGERWVMDGNYSKAMPQRLKRATGVILLEVPTAVSLVRYVRRSLVERDRRGGLEGGRDSVKWDMIHHIVVTTPKIRARYAAQFEQIAVPKIRLASAAAIRDLYRDWALQR